MAKKKSFTAREIEIVKLAREQWHKDGAVEVDYAAPISEGDDNGAYVQAWVWVDFSDTPLDKEPEPKACDIHPGCCDCPPSGVA